MLILCAGCLSAHNDFVSSGTGTPTSTFLSATLPAVVTNKQWTLHYQTFDGVEMALVPPGCFMMGSSDSQIADAIAQAVKHGWAEDAARERISNEGPQHKICFTQGYWIDKTEVTQSQFKSLDGKAAQTSYYKGDNRPVERVTWFEARDFCANRGGQLPTEAEWEYAARGPDSLTYPWGNTFNTLLAVWHRDSFDGTAAAGSNPDNVSWVGALDMSGNVMEWTSSIYVPYPYDATDGRESNTDDNSLRIIRNGSWNSDVSIQLLSAFRDRLHPSYSFNSLGFRCARPLPG